VEYNFSFLMSKAESALNYLSEGKRLYSEIVENYGDAKAVLSDTEQTQIDAKLEELRAKSAEVHEAIQNQE
jgi:hypothetical protein